MRRVGIPRRLFLLTSPIEGLKVTAAIVQVCGCSQAKAILSLVSDSYHTWAFVFGKRAEMRVMRVGRTIDRAVWLAKRGGECQRLDPEIMAGISFLQNQNLYCCTL